MLFRNGIAQHTAGLFVVIKNGTTEPSLLEIISSSQTGGAGPDNSHAFILRRFAGRQIWV